jgi:catechol 2,3-dioxygenase-like lactoylglutathione lyase family enzyme
MKRILLLMLTGVLLFTSGKSQNINRPPIWGIAKMTFLVSDFSIARDYYGKFLGYEEAFSYNSELGKILSFKVNDRQYLEFIEDKNAREKNRFISVSFDCDDIPGMEAFLASKNVEILKKTGRDGAGNEVLRIQSTEFYQIEFIHFHAKGLHKRSAGKHIGKGRIAPRLHHAGLYISDVEKADRLYRDILGFTDMWRANEDNNARPNWIYLRMPDCVENIEYIVNDDIHSSHPCFMVEDMQETIYTLKERNKWGSLARPAIGRGNRWLLNLRNEDNTRVEFTESFTIR